MKETNQQNDTEEEIPLISYHGDADGIASLVLYLKGKGLSLNVVDYYCPSKFGDVGKNPDVVLDQTPKDSDWSGLCYDHHNQHPEERDYELVFDDIPTSGILYEEFKDVLDREDAWKVVIGIAGDGQPELVPQEIWEDYPILQTTSGWTKRNYGNLKYYTQPVYSMIKTLINAPARMGAEEVSFTTLWEATSPIDILFDETLRTYKKNLDKEMRSVEKKMKLIDMRDIAYAEYSSEMRLYINMDLKQSTGKTAVILNTNNGKVSATGPQARSIADFLNEKGVDAGGHQGYCGGHLPETMTPKQFRELLFEFEGLNG